MNLITELANTTDGVKKLQDNDIVNKLLSYINNPHNIKPLRFQKAVLWILAKICKLN
jgi:hypothetical protein